MEPWLIVVIVVVVILFILVAWVIGKYNLLVKARNRVKNSWSQIDVQLKRRFDLIPNLMETVKGYAGHEKSIFDEFAKARNMYQAAASEGNISDMAKADGALGKTLGRLMMVTESYPQLKADKHFSDMMAELRGCEDKIAYSRQFYNDVVLTYNNSRETFPTIIIANMFSFKEADFFKVQEEEKENVKVKF